ncbi:MAG: hypothetical protein ACFFD8_01270 [Candidatus Thorarchaeota archaeon]
MKRYIGMIEVLGESGELQPLHWNPKHLVDGRTILVVDEIEGIIWVWLGPGSSMLQRTTALRQARFIMRNGIHVDEIHFGTKCTNFIEVPGDLKNPKASLLKKLLETTQKTSDFLVVIEEEPVVSTFDEILQERAEVFEKAIAPEPTRQVTPQRRRILAYEEQLASKVLFAVTDCYGQGVMTPLGPNEFQVSVLRLQLRFFCQGDNILFSEIRATAQEDIDAFTRCFGQQPQLTAEGDQIIAQRPMEGIPVPNGEETPVSVVDSMRKQLSKLSTGVTSEENTDANREDSNENAVNEEEPNDKNTDDKENGGSSDFELFG